MAFSGRSPTKAEREWMADTCEGGCIVCDLEFGVYSPASPHHIAGKTKPGAHFMTIPLCHPHHQGGKDCDEYTSRHPYKARFEERYETEDYLLEQTQKRVAEKRGVVYG